MIKSRIFGNSKIDATFFDSSGYTTGDLDGVVFMNQVHSDIVCRIAGVPLEMPKCDGLVTDKKLALGVRTADCMSILMADISARIIAAVHAGWKGTLSGIAEKTFELFVLMGSVREGIRVSVGPHIRKCCYKIDSERARVFRNRYPESIRDSQDGHFLSLIDVLYFQAEEAGIKREQIEDVGVCTGCDGRFASYRRNRDDHSRNISIIRLKQ